MAGQAYYAEEEIFSPPAGEHMVRR